MPRCREKVSVAMQPTCNQLCNLARFTDKIGNTLHVKLPY